MLASSRKAVILIIENEEETRRLYADALYQLGVEVVEAGNSYEAFDQLDKHRVSCVVTDINMPGGGVEYLSLLRHRLPRCPIVAVTGIGGDSIRQAAVEAGATVFLEKPVMTARLRTVISDLLANRLVHLP